VAEPASISTGIAARYATAVFELAKSAKSIDGLDADISTLAVAFDGSNDLQNLVTSPIYSRAEKVAAVQALAAAMGLGELLTNTLALLADKRRLFVLSYLIEAVRTLIAREKGEVTADVTAARKLTKAQETKLSAALKKAVGQNVIINTTVDKSLIGGLVVKVGSKMIDSSIASKLSNLQNAMKEVG